MARTNNLTNFLNDVATAIKTKLGDDTPIPASQFDTKIGQIETGGTYQSKTINVTTNGSQTITPDTGYDALSSILINVQVPIPALQTKNYEFTQNTHIVLSPETGYDGFSSIDLTINVPGSTINNQDKTITQNGSYTADSGYTGLGEVTVNVPSLDTSDATATASDIISPKTAYVDGEKVTGTIPDPNTVYENFSELPSPSSVGKGFIQSIVDINRLNETFSFTDQIWGNHFELTKVFSNLPVNKNFLLINITSLHIDSSGFILNQYLTNNTWYILIYDSSAFTIVDRLASYTNPRYEQLFIQKKIASSDIHLYKLENSIWSDVTTSAFTTTINNIGLNSNQGIIASADYAKTYMATSIKLNGTENKDRNQNIQDSDLVFSEVLDLQTILANNAYNSIKEYFSDGTSWKQIASSSKDADAVASNILLNKTAYANNTKITGSMPNNGAMNITPSTSQQSIPAGYTSGGTVGAVTSAIDSNIQAGNIKRGVTILGVEGTYEGSSSGGGNLPSINAGDYSYEKTFTMDGSGKSTDGYLPMVDVYSKDNDIILIVRNLSSTDSLHVWYEGEEDYDITIPPQNKSKYLYESDEPVSNVDVTYMHNASSFDWIKQT